MPREQRIGIFRRMMLFLQKAEFKLSKRTVRYSCDIADDAEGIAWVITRER